MAHITYHGNPPWTANACAQTELDGGFAACVGTRFGGLRTAIYAFIASIVLVAGVLILAVLVLRRRAPMSR